MKTLNCYFIREDPQEIPDVRVAKEELPDTPSTLYSIYIRKFDDETLTPFMSPPVFEGHFIRHSTLGLAEYLAETFISRNLEKLYLYRDAKMSKEQFVMIHMPQTLDKVRTGVIKAVGACCDSDDLIKIKNHLVDLLAVSKE